MKVHQSPALDFQAIAALLQREVKPVILLGAGASFKSGIPLAGMLVRSIARFAYCKVYNRDPDDPTLMPSDWIRWLEQQTWFRGDVPEPASYPAAVEYLLQPQINRKEFFQRVLRPDVLPSEGYRRLANLLARKLVRTVLTTNFDDLVVRVAKQTPSVRHVEEIMTLADHTLFRTNPPDAQVVYLHGSVNHYTDKNLLKETEELDPALVNLLQPLLRDHPLVVIGYRGSEPSIMKHLLIQQAAVCRQYREGIYWCHLPGTVPAQESLLVAELAATIGTNLQFVEIDGFDELLIAMDRVAELSAAYMWASDPIAASPQGSHRPNDLQPSSLSLGDLNEPLLRAKLIAYAEAMRLPKPDLGTSVQLWSAMVDQNLAHKADGRILATKGAQLLFARSSQQQMEYANIQVTIAGPDAWINEVLDQPLPTADTTGSKGLATISGDLWSQLDQASSLLSRVNRPFRMKGPVSQTAYPYPPLALKELLTNLLAHRSYMDQRQATLTITREEITFENPGGLVESLRRQLEDETIQQAMGGSVRRLKGYRNPVVADFFFSAGAMDKEGSGLPDVLQEAANNLNVVEFGPTSDNTGFVAVIRCRPEALLIDEETRTARAQQGELRYSPNLLRIVAWPEHVTKLGTLASPQTLGLVEKTGSAPFGFHRGWIWTFAKVGSTSAAPLVNLSIAEERHEVLTNELLKDPDSGSSLPRLLNKAFGPHLISLGLRVRFERGRIRAYYPADNGKAREISYRSAFRQSRRTVAKPIVSRSTGKTVYWEHRAVSLRFERFDEDWALSLLPGYVFSLDGDSRSIPSERVGPLSTRRAARDYNPTVLHDLVFWARMLSNSAESLFTIQLADGEPPPTVTLASMIPTIVFQEVIESGMSDATEDVLDDSELDVLQDEIEQEIAKTIAEADETDEVSDR
jgi:NAD-dependent SIR2 family protein deacetylase